MTRIARLFTLAASAALVVAMGLVRSGSLAGEEFVVHEWGTFTSLQDEHGTDLSGINVDDEPVPDFVYNLNQFLLAKPLLSRLHWMKGAPRMHPYITTRLETPVIYFYPPKSWPAGKTIDVTVQFRGGWLTQFYPQAEARVPMKENNQFDFGRLTRDTTSSLDWKNLQIGTTAAGPETDERVWLAPRQVKATNVTAASGESERYLFYRGVGRQPAALRAVMNRKAGEIRLHANFPDVLATGASAQIPAIWLVHVRHDGQCAFRELGGVRVSSDTQAPLTKAGFRFASEEYEPANRQRLETAMKAALIADGLYDDEATALLTTWQRSYFVSPGLRLFYMVPRVWTDHYLPLSLSAEARIERVMVGRLELISDEQRSLLDRLARSDVSDGKWVEQIPKSAAREAFFAGRSNFGDLGVRIPADYQAYLDLGRFRNALVVHEERAHPTENITRFINTYQLHPFRVAE